MVTNAERNAECKLRYEGLTYPTNLHGDILILEYRNKKNVLVKFLDSGRITTTRMANIKTGIVREPTVEVGDIFETNLNGKLEVIEYKNAFNVKVRFLDTGYETVVEASQIRSGEVRDWTLPRAVGVGIGWESGVNLSKTYPRHHGLWQNMLNRCYNNKTGCVGKYVNCSVSEDFLSFENFKTWCDNQIGFNTKDDKGKVFALDKDILVKGNLIYSENTCCFVPRAINNLFLTSKKKRGLLPLGVQQCKTKKVQYYYQLSKRGRQVKSEIFSSPEDAFHAYKKAKEDYIKEVATDWKDEIDPRVYEVLMNYQVEITD